MRKFIKYIIGFIGAALLQTSCYDDKGDYNYHDVNTMEVVIPETKLRMPKEEAVEVSIIPQISQTLEKNEENLVFQWKKAKAGIKAGSDRFSDYEDYSVGKECKITVEPYESENIGLMLIVTDQKNGTTWYKVGEIKIIRPLNPCWFVLQEKEEKGLLGAIEGSPEGFYVYPDVFKSESNLSFPLEGKPLAVSARKVYGNAMAAAMLGSMGLKANPALMLVTDKDAALITPSTLGVMYKSDKILFEPTMQGKEVKIDYYKMGIHGEIFVNEGKAYCAYMDGFCIPYSIRKGEEFPTISAYGTYGSNMLYFDVTSHCFFKSSALSYPMDYMYISAYTSRYIRNGSSWTDQKPISVRSVGQNSTLENVFNPDVVDASLLVKDIITGGKSGCYAYAVAAPQNGKELTVFKFSSQSDEPACAAKYVIVLPPDVDVEKAKFAASFAYTTNNIFMAAGNILYRIDLDRGRVVELYTYDKDPSAQITCLKFKDSENEEELGMSLGLGINTADKGVVVELQLTVAGDVDRAENSICIYEDTEHPLGRIVDITYNYE